MQLPLGKVLVQHFCHVFVVCEDFECCPVFVVVSESKSRCLKCISGIGENYQITPLSAMIKVSIFHPIQRDRNLLSKHLRRQPNSIEDTLICIPATITNITTVNCQAVSLGPRSVRLAAPVHAVGIVIGGLHLLLLIHL